MSRIRIPAGLAPIAAIHVRDSSNTVVDVAVGKIRDASNSLKTFFASFQSGGGGSSSVVASPDTLWSTQTSGGAVAVTTSPSTVSITGGISPYTYSWAAIGGDPGWTILNATSASASFRNLVPPSSQIFGTFQCTVTDAAGQVAVSNPVSAIVGNNYGGFV